MRQKLLVVLLLPTLWRVVLPFDAQVRVIVALMLPPRLVAVVHDPRIGLTKRGRLRKESRLMTRSVVKRQQHVKGLAVKDWKGCVFKSRVSILEV